MSDNPQVEPELKAGDKVNFIHIQYMGRTTKLYSWDGEIVSINGESAAVKRKGKTYYVPLQNCRGINKRCALTELVMGKK